MPLIDKVLSNLEHLERQDLERHFVEMAGQLKQIRAWIDLSPEGLVAINGAKKIIFTNQAARNILSVADSMKRKAGLFDVIEDSALKKLLLACLEKDASCLHREIEMLAPRNLILEVSVVPMDEADMSKGHILILSDRTFYRVSERTERKREKTQSVLALAQAVAHEIGNPLNSIGIQMKLLQKEAEHFPPEARQKLNKTIRALLDETERLDRTIRQFLTLSRQKVMRFRKININNVIRDAVKFMAAEFQTQHITYSIELSDEVPAFLADGEELYRAFLNLLKNAMESMPGGGRIAVKSKRSGKLITVSFSDTGRGIPKSERERIFDLYYTTKPMGSGLGLPIVERIISEHGGRIDVEGSAGKGSTFLITLPVRQQRLELSQGAGKEEGL